MAAPTLVSRVVAAYSRISAVVGAHLAECAPTVTVATDMSICSSRMSFYERIMDDSSLVLGFTTGRILLVSEGQLSDYSIRYGPFELSRAVRGLGPEKERVGIIDSILDQLGHGLGEVSLASQIRGRWGIRCRGLFAASVEHQV